METIKSIFNKTTDNKALVEKSLYFQSNNKLVRFSDHKAKYYNVIENNSNTDELLLIFVNSNLSEIEMQKNCEEISNELNISVEYNYYSDEENTDIDYLKTFINTFLK